MTTRSGSWMMALGTAVSLIGLCFLPAAFGSHPDGNLLGMGASIFSLGTLAMAGGMYLKAQALKATSSRPTQIKPARNLKNPCELCKNEVPVVHCKVHQLHLCGDCLSEHYDFRSCVYAPSTRRISSKPAKSMSARTRG